MNKDLKRFLTGNIESVQALEVLLLLFRAPARWWSSETVAAELGTNATDAEALLEVLASRRFLDVRLGSSVLFRYKPLTDSLDANVRELFEQYRQHRLAVISVVTSARTDAARRFAAAFRLRHGKEDGDG